MVKTVLLRRESLTGPGLALISLCSWGWHWAPHLPTSYLPSAGFLVVPPTQLEKEQKHTSFKYKSPGFQSIFSFYHDPSLNTFVWNEDGRYGAPKFPLPPCSVPFSRWTGLLPISAVPQPMERKTASPSSPWRISTWITAKAAVLRKRYILKFSLLPQIHPFPPLPPPTLFSGSGSLERLTPWSKSLPLFPYLAPPKFTIPHHDCFSDSLKVTRSPYGSQCDAAAQWPWEEEEMRWDCWRQESAYKLFCFVSAPALKDTAFL